MLQFMQSGGWVMIPILLCSFIAAVICIERAWTLRRSHVAPDFLLAAIIDNIRENDYVVSTLFDEMSHYPLGTIFSAGLRKSQHGFDEMKSAMEEVSQTVVHSLEKYLTALGTIASIAPLLGLLGTVIGMIQVFTGLMAGSDATGLAGGISEALVTTAFGIGIAIPALICHRYFLRRIDELMINMEIEARELVEFVRDHFSADLDE